MTTPPDGPADTTMMRIVHDALRRDVDRVRTTLTPPHQASPSQRRAIGAHVGWMIRFLHAHHASEDDGLYPLVRARCADDPDACRVLDRMADEHQAIAGPAAALDEAAAALVVQPDDGATQELLAALDTLAAVLLPHLREEEDEAMPLASRLVTAAEWHAIEKEHNLDPKSSSELGFEGHWLIDGATAADRATVLGLVPPVPRFVLLHGFARSYRRHVDRCWGGAERPARHVQTENRVAVTVGADIDAVWEVVRDVTRVGEWSHECVSAAWLDGAHDAAPGARFRGRNRAGVLRWGRTCEVVSAEPYTLVWRTVPTALSPDSSEWRISLERAGGATTIAQEFRVVRAPRVLGVLYALLIPAHRDRTAALVADLERLALVAGSTGAGDPARDLQTSPE